MKNSDKQNIVLFIKRLARNGATEDLIGFVADHEGMLRSCRRFLELQRENTGTGDWLQQQCRGYKIEPGFAINEIKRVLKIFTTNDAADDSFEILGLGPEASLAEVKQAFRRLSRKYHPDSAGSSGPEDAARFISICQAYKAILAKAADINTVVPAAPRPWLYRKKSISTPRQKKNNIFIISGLATILLLVSLVAPFIYRKHVMLSQFAAGPSPQKTPEKQMVADNAVRPVAKVAAEAMMPPGKKQKSLPDKPEPDSLSNITRDDSIRPGKANSAQAAKDQPPKIGSDTTEISPHAATADTQTSQPKNSEEDKTTAAGETRQETTSDNINKPESGKTTNFPMQAEMGFRPETKGNAEITSSSVLSPQSRTKTKEPQPATTHLTQSSGTVAKKHLAEQPQQRVVQYDRSGHSPDPPSPTPKVQAQLSGELLRLRVLHFLEDYTASYQHKDLQSFASHFTPKALENGTPFQNLQEDYEKLFAKVNSISLAIVPDSWTDMDQMVQVHGHFHMRLEYKRGTTVKFKGRISLLLQEQQDSLKVQELSYWFDKTK